MPDHRVVYPIQRLQHELSILIIPPPPSAPDDDPLVIAGSCRKMALGLATAAWSEAYPGETGEVQVYHVPLAMAALAGRVMEGGPHGIGWNPTDDRYRLVEAKVVPLPEPVPAEVWEATPRPRWQGPYARLLQQFVESGMLHAEVQWSGKPPRSLRKRLRMAMVLGVLLRRTARSWGFPATALTRQEKVFLSRTDLEEPSRYEAGEEPDES